MSRRKTERQDEGENTPQDDGVLGGLFGGGADEETPASEPAPEPAPEPIPEAEPMPQITEEDNCVLIVMDAAGARRIDPPLTSQTYMFYPGLPTKVCPEDRDVLVGHKKLAESGVTFAPSDGSEEPSDAVKAELRKAERRKVRINPGCGCSQ